MLSNTPKFDSALDAILSPLKPHKKTCQQCGGNFDIFAEDIAFYKKLRVPPPMLCPDCRSQRRLAYRVSFLPIFYKKACSAPGHSEPVITFHPPENYAKVFDDKYYLSDAWEATQYGHDYDPQKPFFEQFQKLSQDTPHQTLQKDPKSVNCDYVVSGVSSKNCYYFAVPFFNEDVYYGFLSPRSKNCVDILHLLNSELCYEAVESSDSYNSNFIQESNSCIDSSFLFDCNNCSNCFGCTNLRHKQYYFFNQSLTKEEYEAKMREINLGSRKILRQHIEQFRELWKNAIRRNLYNLNSKNSIGDNLLQCNNCFWSFASLSDSENVRYCQSFDKIKDTMDMFGATLAELVYDSTAAPNCNKVKFSVMIRTGLEVEYSMECNNCEYLFGCFGLRNKKYCIFNKQYEPEEYWRRVDEIKIAMLARGEYGEFFSIKDSPFPYNDTNASIEFPLTKAEVTERGWSWRDEGKAEGPSGPDVLRAADVPDDITDVTDDILNKTIICERTGKPFRITKFELDFYRKKNLPLPIVHPLERIRDKHKLRRPYKLHKSICKKCGQEMYSIYPSEKNYNVYCEACYQTEVI